MSENDTPTPSYAPPQQVASNSDIAALIQQAVDAALAKQQAEQQAASQPRVVSPEEAARAALDNAGAGLGIDERLAELYAVVSHLASKVGV